MRKNINKIVAFAIGISIMSGSIMPVFAADSTQSASTTKVQTQTNKINVLTLDEAIKSAISISDTLALDEKKISYQDKTNDLYDDQDDTTNIDDDVQDFNKDNADIKLNQAKQQSDFDEDSLRKKVTDKYNDIVTKQINIDKTAKDLDVKKTELAQMKLKVSIGSEISTNLKTKEHEIQDAQNTLTNSQNELKDLEYSFKALSGKDVTQYTLEKDIKFEPLKIDGSIDNYLDDVIVSYLKYSEQIVKLNQDYFDNDYADDKKTAVDDAKDALDKANTEVDDAKKVVDDPSTVVDEAKKAVDDADNNLPKIKDNYTNAIAGRIAYFGTKKGIYTDEVNLSEDKKNFKDSLKSYYTQLINAEKQINADKNQIEITNEKLSNYKLKYDLGMITENVYKSYVVQSEADNISLRNEIILYNQTKEKIQKPWLTLTKSAPQSQQQHLNN